MLRFFTRLSVLICFFISAFTNYSFSQDAFIKGKIIDSNNNPIENVSLRLKDFNSLSCRTDANGTFECRMPAGLHTLLIEKGGYLVQELELDLKSEKPNDLGTINLGVYNPLTSDGEDATLIPTISVSDDDISGDPGSGQDISGLLTASRDVFVSAASFAFGAARFRIRGYDAEYGTVTMNGVPVNGLDDGRVVWSEWGGLNDVMRNRESNIGLFPSSIAFSGIGGLTSIDSRASKHRKQTQVTYSLSNRNYTHRLMFTHSTGLNKNGWAFSVSASRRWAQEGYLPGTFYDAWAYFAGVEKRFGDKHALSFTVFGAPTVKGNGGVSTQEMYDLAGDNYYNPNWGYQNGEKRNARVATNHKPTFILRYDWKPTVKTSIAAMVSHAQGINSLTRLDWGNVNDPRPDYYSKLPSYVLDPTVREQVADAFRNNESLRQLNWQQFYDVNRANKTTITDLDGQQVTGNRALYFLNDSRIYDKEYNGILTLQHLISDRLTFDGGVSYRVLNSRNYMTVDDLLGADFAVNIDKFAERDFPADPNKKYNDLDAKTLILKEGDVYSYDYNAHVNQGQLWGQLQYSLPKFDFFAGVEGSTTTLWREGNIRNGRFPDNSLGNSDKLNFVNYNVKLGITYKIDGRNYVYVNGFTGSKAPMFSNTFVAPRTRNSYVHDIPSEKINSLELGYVLRTPYWKARITAYATKFTDQTEIKSFYTDEDLPFEAGGDSLTVSAGGFINYLMKGVDKIHRGVELAAEYKLTPSITLDAVAAIGQYFYDSRPLTTITLDNAEATGAVNQASYIKGFYIANTPQKAYKFGINYHGKNFWYVNVNFNYFDGMYIDVNPNRRTEKAVSLIESKDDPLWSQMLDQQKLDAQFTMDIFGGKSFKFGKYYLNINVGLNNVLNNKDFVTGGFEQLRLGYDNVTNKPNPNKFPPKYFYAYGFNYMLNVSFRF